MCRKCRRHSRWSSGMNRSNPPCGCPELGQCRRPRSECCSLQWGTSPCSQLQGQMELKDGERHSAQSSNKHIAWLANHVVVTIAATHLLTRRQHSSSKSSRSSSSACWHAVDLFKTSRNSCWRHLSRARPLPTAAPRDSISPARALVARVLL